jgi:hypothetical protein
MNGGYANYSDRPGRGGRDRCSGAVAAPTAAC